MDQAIAAAEVVGDEALGYSCFGGHCAVREAAQAGAADHSNRSVQQRLSPLAVARPWGVLGTCAHRNEPIPTRGLPSHPCAASKRLRSPGFMTR